MEISASYLLLPSIYLSIHPSTQYHSYIYIYSSIHPYMNRLSHIPIHPSFVLTKESTASTQPRNIKEGKGCKLRSNSPTTGALKHTRGKRGIQYTWRGIYFHTASQIYLGARPYKQPRPRQRHTHAHAHTHTHAHTRAHTRTHTRTHKRPVNKHTSPLLFSLC